MSDKERKLKKFFSRILWGLFLIGLGVILFLRKQGYEFNIFFTGWWTLFIIVPSIVSLIAEDDKAGGVIGLALGVALLLGARGIIEYEKIWQYWLPIVLVAFGIDVIFKRRDKDDDED